MTARPTITPNEFQEVCDQALLAVDGRYWPPDAVPYDLANAVITEVHKRLCLSLGEIGEEKHPIPPNDERIEEIVKLVSRHWTGPILVERTINETIRMVVEHWRERLLPQ